MAQFILTDEQRKRLDLILAGQNSIMAARDASGKTSAEVIERAQVQALHPDQLTDEQTTRRAWARALVNRRYSLNGYYRVTLRGDMYGCVEMYAALRPGLAAWASREGWKVGGNG